MKKTKILLILFILITFISSISNATYNDVTMSVVEEPISTIKYGDNSYVERSVISKDLEKKEITIQLKVTNNEGITKPTGELMLVIDNSNSMLDSVYENENLKRKDVIIDSAKSLITKLLEDNTKLKIGAVSFSTKSVSDEGKATDAKIVSELTTDASHLIDSISNIEYDGPRTNLDAGISLAKQYFSNETDKSHKYIIVLSDGVPNVAIDFDNYYYSDDVVSKTKSSLQSLSNISDNVIVMLTGITEGDSLPTYVPEYTGTKRTYNQIIAEIFGTPEKPTIGKFYPIPDDKIEETIKTNIYNDLLPISKTFTDIKVVDYFSKEIVDNFDFSYVKDPNFGTISSEIDKTTNSITWTIPKLKPNETAIVQYKLKLKTDYNEDILDKVLDTNPKLDLTYTDYSNTTDTKTSDVTPKIKLTEPKEELPKEFPKAGKTIFFNVIGIITIISIVLGFKYFFINNKMK